MTERQVGTKGLGVLEIKDADKGEVEAIVATLDVVDRDREVIRSGAIQHGTKVKLSEWAHNSIPMLGGATAPVGKGTLQVEGKQVRFRGKFFLGTTRGAEAFAMLKEMGPEQEWSLGYIILGTEIPDDDWREKGARLLLTKLEPFEVSPVGVGAGLGTRTVNVKCADCGAKEDAPCTCGGAAADEARRVEEAAAAVVATKQAAELQAVAAQEFERFQRTFQRFGT